jgi:hypothetical protein
VSKNLAFGNLKPLHSKAFARELRRQQLARARQRGRAARRPPPGARMTR